MCRRAGATAALVAALWISAAGRDGNGVDNALERAALDWDKGDYIAALTIYQDLLAGPNAAQALESISLQTGEFYRSHELTNDGANPVFSPDGRRFSFETGQGIVAGDVAGVERLTHVRTIDLPSTDLTTVPGGSVSFCPDGRHLSWFRVPVSPEIVQAQNALISSQSGTDRVQRQLALNRLIARDARIMLRDLDSGHDEELQTGDLYKAAGLCGANASVLFAGAGANETTATQIYSVAAGSQPVALTEGDGFKLPSSVDAAGRVVLFLVPRLGPFRSGVPTAQPPGAAGDVGGGRGATAGGAANVASTSFGVLAGGKSSIIRGTSPALSRNGRAIAWIERAPPGAAAAEQRLVTAPTDDPASAVALHKGTERLDAPALSADGSRIAFQMMPHEDWEIYVIGRDGSGEMRVTHEIQHDILPQFLTDTRLLAAIGEPRHRRSFLYDLPSMKRTRLFHNNTVRTIAPEYSWLGSADGTRILIVAERDGDTVSPERGVYLMDLTSTVTLQELRARVAENLRTERLLRESGHKMFAPIAEDVRRIVATISPARAYAHEKALFDFDSKHITQPGNRLASEYLFNAYKSFGYEPEYQWFAPRTALGGRTANVIARLPGTVDPDVVYVVGSHYDSVAGGPGADDDTSGTAALLETARALAGHQMPATIIFASFTGEEAGLLGSREFVRRAIADKMTIAGVLNNDMIGWANDYRLDDTIRYSNPGIRDVQHGAAIEFTNLITYDALYYKGTDAASFYEVYGDIAGGIGSYPVLGNPHYHQPHDLLEGINHQLIAEVAKTTVATLMLLASTPSRITGLQATANGGVARVSWTAALESDVAGYVVTWGPADNPNLHTTRVQKPEATLSSAPTGTRMRVKALNAQGMEGWDWARTIVR